MILLEQQLVIRVFELDYHRVYLLLDRNVRMMSMFFLQSVLVYQISIFFDEFSMSFPMEQIYRWLFVYHLDILLIYHKTQR